MASRGHRRYLAVKKKKKKGRLALWGVKVMLGGATVAYAGREEESWSWKRLERDSGCEQSIDKE